MRLTHFGHSTVLVETATARVLLDPGNFSTTWWGLTDLDAIAVTHQHPDHIDPDRLPALLAANPTARLLVEPSLPDVYDLPGAERLAADASVSLGGLRIAAVGGLHAVIHRDIPRIGNVGLVVSAPGEPRFFHPGPRPLVRHERDHRLRPAAGRPPRFPHPRRPAQRARLGAQLRTAERDDADDSGRSARRPTLGAAGGGLTGRRRQAPGHWPVAVPRHATGTTSCRARRRVVAAFPSRGQGLPQAADQPGARRRSREDGCGPQRPLGS